MEDHLQVHLRQTAAGQVHLLPEPDLHHRIIRKGQHLLTVDLYLYAHAVTWGSAARNRTVI